MQRNPDNGHNACHRTPVWRLEEHYMYGIETPISGDYTTVVEASRDGWEACHD